MAEKLVNTAVCVGGVSNTADEGPMVNSTSFSLLTAL